MRLYPQNPERIANVIGIDPGTQSLGLCCISFDVDTLAITRVHAETFIGDKLNPDECLSQIHSDRFARIEAHKNNLVKQFNIYNPNWIICESPFFNTKRPQAFSALVEIVNAIRYAVVEYDNITRLELIDPPSVKKAVGAAGNAKKDGVMAAILNIDELCLNSTRPMAMMDEHSIDASAVCYYKFNEIRKSLLVKEI